MTDCPHTHIKCQKCFRDIEVNKVLGPPPLQEALVRIRALEDQDIISQDIITELRTRIRFLELTEKEMKALTDLMVGVVHPEDKDNGHSEKL